MEGSSSSAESRSCQKKELIELIARRPRGRLVEKWGDGWARR